NIARRWSLTSRFVLKVRSALNFDRSVYRYIFWEMSVSAVLGQHGWRAGAWQSFFAVIALTWSSLMVRGPTLSLLARYGAPAQDWCIGCMILLERASRGWTV